MVDRNQKIIFEKQINIALDFNLPIVIHCRESFDEIYNILLKYKSKNLSGVFHCFSGNYDQALKKKITKIICIAVNDPNVMKAWGENHNVGNKILMAGDPFLKFTKAIGAEVDKSAKGLGIRSNRYTMLVEHDVVKKIEEEKDTAICNLSSAENFLKAI